MTLRATTEPRLIATPAELEIVYAALTRHLPRREVWAFGSRVKGRIKKFSDLDLAVIGEEPLTFSTRAALTEEFAESDLPYKVDIVDWATTAESFRKRIEAAHVTLQHAGGSKPSIELG